MRLIHTADWHLCDRLGRIDRTKDLEARVEKVAALCEEHAADVLLIAGDLFSEQASVDDMTRALNHIREVFKPLFARGGTVLAITGNHDRDGRINMVRAGMTLAAPGAGAGGHLAGGRMYLINGRAVVTLAGRAGDRVQFVLVPYPFASRYDLSAAEYRGREEETRLLHSRVAEWVQAVSSKPPFDPTLPTVLAAHLHVRGSELHTLYKMTERDDVLFDFADLNPAWAYVALGHIHKPQRVDAPSPAEYAGSPLQLDFGEADDVKSFVVIDAEPGVPATIRRVPYEGGRRLSTIAASLPELEARAEELRDTGWLRVRVSAPKRDPDLAGKVRQLLENAVVVELVLPEHDELATGNARPPADAPPRDLFRAYFASRHGRDPDAAVLDAFDRLLTETDTEVTR